MGIIFTSDNVHRTGRSTLPSEIAAMGSDRQDITVYWKPGCSSCLKLKEFMEERAIAYTSVNVMSQPKAMDELLAA